MDIAVALEKLFPKQCHVLGIVAPGIVGERSPHNGVLPCVAMGSQGWAPCLWLKSTVMLWATRGPPKAVVFAVVTWAASVCSVSHISV